ncbi:MAG: type effector [Tardiphaga sp.]|jgi:uncharacterized protein YgbK (DUF1537 family)|nr:type effector [Tardiphaga sp.]
MSASVLPNSVLPNGPLVAFYGDDYTGSSAAMEALAFAGLPTILFLEPPTPQRLAAAAHFHGIGIAGTARSQSNPWMEQNLPSIFRTLAAIGAPFSHYKTCSTFDSAPHIGSIGRAADLAIPLLGGQWHPMIVASPAMGRYQAFGHLFATVDGTGYRLDRHPTMSRHPVTPMDEADLGRHLARQTSRTIGLVDFVTMAAGHADAALMKQIVSGAEIISIDVLDRKTLEQAGRLMWDHRGERLFAVGSQGVEQALVAHWQAVGLIETPDRPAGFAAVDRMAGISGSCSPVTSEQISYAEKTGFEIIRVDATRAVAASAWQNEIDRSARIALDALSAGRDPLLVTARGADDPAIAALRTAVETSGSSLEQVNARIGSGLGQALNLILAAAKLRRVVVAGGDTSGHAVKELNMYALSAIAPLASGAPLCLAASEVPAFAIEIVLKGGQVGQTDLFRVARDGHSVQV